ncbi:PREDICTED: uncharacterized protein LOC109235776 [Nicotiana attenuata]|uniref:uncharacterized protein LOC109235776 n=1 Tax=Nicotiana attenuata TaxID=49451 RepID=UPI00090507E0|nr:PREDICTED: uncharacterized protein LOC109235776 [Nicotiana attenuata]
MDQQKIQAIIDWTMPKDIHTLRAFLGLCNFYRRFVKNYSLIAVPFTKLLKKVMPWDWGPKRAGAFNALKVAMSSSLVLALPDLAKPFKVLMDASGYALGGALLQEGHLVAYESRKLKDAERALRRPWKKNYWLSSTTYAFGGTICWEPRSWSRRTTRLLVIS